MLSSVRDLPQSPYRQPAARRREVQGPREASAGVVTCFVVLLFVLTEALSAEPPPGQASAVSTRMARWPLPRSSRVAGLFPCHSPARARVRVLREAERRPGHYRRASAHLCVSRESHPKQAGSPDGVVRSECSVA